MVPRPASRPRRRPRLDADVVVLGAGPAGLGAAFRAAEQGLHVAVLERAGHVGGAAASFEVAGQRVDLGSHRLHPATSPAILAVLAGLLGSDLQQRPRRGRLRLAGRWLAFPPRAADLVRHLPPRLAARMVADAATRPLRRAGPDTFSDVVRTQLGPTMSEAFYAPYARKVWGLAATELAGEQARRRISVRSPRDLLARVRAPAEARTFFYPRRGFGQISEALARAAADAGADVRLGTAVTGLRPVAHGVDVATPRGHLRGAQVLSTVPLGALARLDAGTPAEVLNAARRLRTRALVLVYLVLGVPRYTRFDAHYLPEAWTPVTRVSEPKNYRDNPDDPADRTVLCAEVPCDRGDDTWSASPAALADEVVDTLRRAGLPPAPVAEVAVRRLAAAYPVYPVGYERDLATVEDWATTLRRVTTLGRQGLHVHDNSHHAMAMAWAAVDALGPETSFDTQAWSRARETFRQHVVED